MFEINAFCDLFAEICGEFRKITKARTNNIQEVIDHFSKLSANLREKHAKLM